jgi:hypothetical protein
MGIIMGAIGGVGDAAQNVGSTMLKSELDTESKLKVGQQDSDLALQRAKALEDYKVAVGNQQREARAARIDSAAQPIVEQGIIAKAKTARANALPEYDPNDTTGPASFHGDAKQAEADIMAMAEGPDKQAALAQLRQQVAGRRADVANLGASDLSPEERTRFAPNADEMTRARVNAAIQTGDIEPKDALANTTRGDIAEVQANAKLAVQEARNEALMARTQAQYDAAMAKIEAGLAKAGKGDTDFDKKIALLRKAGSSDKEIASFITDRKQPSIEDLANGFLKSDPNVGTARALTPEVAYAKAKKLRALTKDLDDEDDNPTPSPAPGAPKKPPLSQFLR